MRTPRRGRRSSAGFTMVELTVSLVAGLIVALAIAGLSREATRTFNEEVRVSAAEAALRTAVDRLRADLQRAAFMSTPNIQMDPMIAKVLGGPNVSAAMALIPALNQLAGIRYNVATTTGLALNAVNPGVAATIIDIAGNMTTSEQFEIQSISPNVGGSGSCTQINLSWTSPAIFRILNASDGGSDPNAAAEMLNIFQPVTGQQFIVRVLDFSGRSQFFLTCANPGASQPVAGIYNSAGTCAPYVYVQGTPLTASQTGGVGGLQGNGVGGFVNPVMVVRWEIVSSSSSVDKEPAQDLNGLSGLPTNIATQDPNKYDLMRSYLDQNGNVLPTSSEIVAEYAVDMDFSFSVDKGITAGTAPAITTYDFDATGSTNNTNVAAVVKPSIVTPATPDPQRIRSVRARLVTRTATADRTLNIATTAPFLYRYCLNTGGCPSTSAAAALVPAQWARARTIVTEVALPNQAQAFY